MEIFRVSRLLKITTVFMIAVGLLKSLVFLSAAIVVFGNEAAFAQSTKNVQLGSNHKQQNTANKDLLTQGYNAMNQGDAATARSLFDRVLTINPKSVEAHTYLGILNDQSGDLKGAEGHFAAAAKLDSESASARNNYGAILVKLKRPSEAAKEFAASLSINPQQFNALVNLAQIRFAENNLLAAHESFERASVIQPDAEVLQALVLISLQLKNTARAAAEFKNYAVARIPSSATVEVASLIALGKGLLENNLLDEARQELEFVVANNADNIDALVLLSKIYLAQKDIKAAGKLLETAIARKIDDAKIYLALSDVYQKGGYFENAIPAMRLAIEKDPHNDLYRAKYGLLLIDSKAPGAAVVRLTEAVKEFPRSARVWLVLGIAQQLDGKMLDAQKSFEQTISLEPGSISGLAYLAVSQIEQANYEAAVKTYQRALAIEPKNAILHFLIADIMLQTPTFDQITIEKHLELAVQLDAELSSAHLTLGKLYARAERWPEAAAEFRQAARSAPDLAEAYYQLGRALTRLKQNVEAKRAIEQYKKLNETQTAQKETDRDDLARRLANVRF